MERPQRGMVMYKMQEQQNIENVDVDEEEIVFGVVKWFDPVKGFGFVVADDGGPDILLHANVLRNFGQGSIAEGTEIEIAIQHTDRGVQAVEVLEISPPEDDGTSTLGEFVHVSPEELQKIELEPSRVKWFDKTKGFGFANVFGFDEDIFVHVEVLRRSGLADLQSGEAVGIRVIDGERGKMAAQVCTWDFAVERQ